MMDKISQFDFRPGKVLASKYVVTKKLGAGWEGEVYLTSEIATGIERATKLFFPHRNVKNRAARMYANKLHSLRSCSSIVQYHSYEMIRFRSQMVTCLISEYVDGKLLSDYQAACDVEHIHYYEALQIVYEIAKALEKIHATGSYHGHLNPENIIMRRRGLKFDVKLIDCIDWGGSKRENIKKDVYDLIKIYYQLIGGKESYQDLPKCLKKVMMGVRRTKLAENFKNASALVHHIEQMQWEQ